MDLRFCPIVVEPDPPLVLLIKTALEAEKHSECTRRHVGCALARINGYGFFEMRGGGYNGMHKRAETRTDPHTCYVGCQPGTCGCLHAEVRAVADLLASGFTDAAVTAAPCLSCARTLLDAGGAGFARLYFWEDSVPGDAGVGELEKYGISVFRIAADVIQTYQ